MCAYGRQTELLPHLKALFSTQFQIEANVLIVLSSTAAITFNMLECFVVLRGHLQDFLQDFLSNEMFHDLNLTLENYLLVNVNSCFKFVE